MAKRVITKEAYEHAKKIIRLYEEQLKSPIEPNPQKKKKLPTLTPEDEYASQFISGRGWVFRGHDSNEN